MTYRQAQLESGTVSLHSHSFSTLSLSSDTVVVQPLYSGLCRADVKEVAGTRGTLQEGDHLFGHEVVGRILLAGPETHFAEGELVTLNPNVRCARSTSFADLMLVTGAAGVLNDALPRVPSHALGPDDWMPEPFACVVHSLDTLLFHLREVRLDGTAVAIFGCGNAGIQFGLYARHLGASVTLFNRGPARREFARRFDAFMSARIVDLNSATDYDGTFDIAILAPTIIEPQILTTAAQVVSAAGSIHLYGGTRAGDQWQGLNIHRIRREQVAECAVLSGKTFRVSGAYGCTRSDFDRAFALRADWPARFPVGQLISRTIDLEELPDILHDMASGRVDYAGKILVKPADLHFRR